MVQEFHKKLGLRIKEIREEKHISRDELGFRADVSGSYIGMIERAEKDLKTSKLFKIAIALGVNVKELFEF